MFLDIIIGQIAILFLITIIGVIASKYKVITEEVKNGIATIIFNITLPFLILTSVSGIELNKEILNNCIYVFSFSVVAQIILFFIIGFFIFKVYQIFWTLSKKLSTQKATR